MKKLIFSLTGLLFLLSACNLLPSPEQTPDAEKEPAVEKKPARITTHCASAMTALPMTT